MDARIGFLACRMLSLSWALATEEAAYPSVRNACFGFLVGLQDFLEAQHTMTDGDHACTHGIPPTVAHATMLYAISERCNLTYTSPGCYCPSSMFRCWRRYHPPNTKCWIMHY